jgi:hypothetical protein
VYQNDAGFERKTARDPHPGSSGGEVNRTTLKKPNISRIFFLTEQDDSLSFVPSLSRVVTRLRPSVLAA